MENYYQNEFVDLLHQWEVLASLHPIPLFPFVHNIKFQPLSAEITSTARRGSPDELVLPVPSVPLPVCPAAGTVASCLPAALPSLLRCRLLAQTSNSSPSLCDEQELQGRTNQKRIKLRRKQKRQNDNYDHRSSFTGSLLEVGKFY